MSSHHRCCCTAPQVCLSKVVPGISSAVCTYVASLQRFSEPGILIDAWTADVTWTAPAVSQTLNRLFNPGIPINPFIANTIMDSGSSGFMGTVTGTVTVGPDTFIRSVDANIALACDGGSLIRGIGASNPFAQFTTQIGDAPSFIGFGIASDGSAILLPDTTGSAGIIFNPDPVVNFDLTRMLIFTTGEVASLWTITGTITYNGLLQAP